jgi:hypothetical protein
MKWTMRGVDIVIMDINTEHIVNSPGRDVNSPDLHNFYEIILRCNATKGVQVFPPCTLNDNY